MKAGDVVRLKSGGPFMTVRRAEPTDILVEWFEGDGLCWGGIRKDSFNAESLILKTELEEQVKARAAKDREALIQATTKKTS